MTGASRAQPGDRPCVPYVYVQNMDVCIHCTWLDAAPASWSRTYRVNPGRRNWLIETAVWIWPSFFHCALETR